MNKLSMRLKEVFSPIPQNICNKILEFSPDIIYIRQITYLSPAYIHTFKKIKGNAKIFYEIPTYPYIQEYKTNILNINNLLANIISFIFAFRSIERLRKVIDEFVVVNEIDDKTAKERLGKHRVITNGFDVSSVSVKKSPKLENEIHILGLANLAIWHGYDRIITGISEYKGPQKIIFHLAGGEGKAEAEKLKKQAMQFGISSNIIFYPPLYGKELSELFDKCHIAAGSLGMHRIKLQKGSILKLREYCSRGIPFLTSYLDDDFNNFKFCVKFEASDEPIDMYGICNFVETIHKTENYPQIMREYAEENLDWKVKMSKLFD
jgi:glycosyltransferase involved in cell wall biosynthesis